MPATRLPGKRLSKAERDQLLIDLINLLQTGYATNHKLAELLKVNDRTVAKLRPVADQIIAMNTPDRNIIRNLAVSRATKMIERLVGIVENTETPLAIDKELKVHDKIVRYSQHLALITGLNTEVHVNVDAKKLVITRAHPSAVKKALKETNAIDGEIV